MELHGDGCIDILSGSYSRHEESMAGLFQVLRGKPDGTFHKAEALNGSDGKPLILPAGDGEDADLDRICTRQFAADLDGDGKLDIVSGNFRGTFGWFRGEGPGKFAPVATMLQAGGAPMAVDAHSDPFLVDLDRDGDLDLLTGSANGGVFLFRNDGSKQVPKFQAKVQLLAPAGHDGGAAEAIQFGDAHLLAPGSATRVWADDVDGDGKLDLLVGDMADLLHLAEGVDEATARTKFAAWQQKQLAFVNTPQGDDEAAQQKWHEAYAALEKEKESFLREERTGFVWLLRGK